MTAALGPVLMGAFKRFAISMIVNMVTNKIFGKQGGAGGGGGAAADPGIMVNQNSNSAPLPLLYGTRRTGGTRVYVETSNGSGSPREAIILNEGTEQEQETFTNTDYLNIVLAIGEGEMGAIKKVILNDTITWDADDATTPGTTTAQDTYGFRLSDFVGKFRERVEIDYFPGNDDQTVSTLIQDSIGATNWSNDHRLRGVAYLACKFTYDKEVWEGGVPLITVELEGKKIQDVSGITAGDTTRTLTSGSSNQNPVDVLYDYLVDKRYGKGLDHDTSGNYLAGLDIDIASFQSARTYVSTRHEIDGVVKTENQIFKNLEEILDSFNGMLIFTGGKYRVKVRQQGETSVFSFSEDNIVGQIEISLPDVNARLNKITTTFANRELESDTADGYTAYNDDVKVTSNATYLAEDRGRILETQLEQNLITDPLKIEALNTHRLDTSRHQLAVTFEAAQVAIQVEAGDIVDVTHTVPGWTNKLFRVLSIIITEDNTLDMVLQEYVSGDEI